MKKIFFKF